MKHPDSTKLLNESKQALSRYGMEYVRNKVANEKPFFAFVYLSVKPGTICGGSSIWLKHYDHRHKIYIKEYFYLIYKATSFGTQIIWTVRSEKLQCDAS